MEIFADLSAKSRSKLYLVLANISIALLFFSIWEIKPVGVKVTDFLGLTSHLTIYYWLGLFLISLVSILIYISKFDVKNYLLIIILIYLSLFLFGIPIFAEENAWNPFSYYPAGEVKTVLTKGYVDTASNYPLISYRAWPGVHMISSFILLITNIEFDKLIKYYPLFWLLCMIFLIFSMGRRLELTATNSFAAVFIFLTSFWPPQYYFSGQSLAIISFISLFMCAYTSRGKKSFEILSIIFFSMLTVTHFLTSTIFLLSSVIQLKLKNYRKELIIFFLVIFLAWLVYLAPYAFQFGIDKFLNQAGKADFFYWEHTQKFSPVTMMRSLVNNFRLSFLAICGFFIAVSTYCYFSNITLKDNKIKIKKIFWWLLALAPFVFIQYGPEVFERVYMFSIVPASYIILLGIPSKKIVSIFMILLLIFHIPAHYGDAISWQTSTVDLKGSEFFGKVYPTERVLSRGQFLLNDAYYGGTRPLIWYDNPEMVKIPSENIGSFETNINQTVSSMLNNASFVIDNGRGNAMTIYYYGFDPIDEWKKNINYMLIYQNENYQIMKVNSIKN
jgi:hypothetical protein